MEDVKKQIPPRPLPDNMEEVLKMLQESGKVIHGNMIQSERIADILYGVHGQGKVTVDDDYVDNKNLLKHNEIAPTMVIKFAQAIEDLVQLNISISHSLNRIESQLH